MIHMLVHGLLVSLVAPLLVVGARRLPLARALLGARLVAHLSRPALAWALFVGMQWALHVRPLGVREAEHALLLATAVLFWLPVAGRHRLDGAARAAYLFLALPALDLIGLWFMASGRPGLGVGMIAGMVPLAVAAVLVTWRWIREELDRARAWEAFSDAHG